MDTIPLVTCFLGVGGALIWFLREAHALFEGEPLDETKNARLKKVRGMYFLLLPVILAGSVSSIFWPQETDQTILAIFVLMFLVLYYFALRDIRKAVRST